MTSRPSPDGTAARALRAAAPAFRPFPLPHFTLRQPRPHGAAAWVVRCLAATALCVLLAACARPGGEGSTAQQPAATAQAAPANATAPAMTRDGLPSGLPFASAGEPRVHMPAPQPSAAPPVPAAASTAPNAAPNVAPDAAPDSVRTEAAAPRSLADFALLGQGAPQADADGSARHDTPQGPVLRILYNASTRGTLHPCPS